MSAHWPHLGIADAAVPVERWVDSNAVPELRSVRAGLAHSGCDPMIPITLVSISVNIGQKDSQYSQMSAKIRGDCTVPDTGHEQGLIQLTFWQQSSTAVLTVHRIRCFTAAFSRFNIRIALYMVQKDLNLIIGSGWCNE